MLKITNQAHFDKVMAFAERTGQTAKLQKELDYLAGYACPETDKEKTTTICRLYADFAPASFSFVMDKKNKNGDYDTWFNGGLIYHGPHDDFGSGSAPTLSVTITPTDGWSVHT